MSTWTGEAQDRKGKRGQDLPHAGGQGGGEGRMGDQTWAQITGL